MSEFYRSVTALRGGEELSADVRQRAVEYCKEGKRMASLQELYEWMCDINPEMPFFDARIAVGAYPEGLAAFVTSCTWEKWQVHAVWALHGDIYLSRLKEAKKTGMDPKEYRDHVAGASNHRANGLMHMARCGAAAGHEQLQLPCWDAPLPLEEIVASAVADMRTACTLRSEKYGQHGCSENTVKAYQAALQNLANALEIHQHVASAPAANMDRMLSRLRESATNLSLSDKKTLAACSDEGGLDASQQRSVAREVRLADGAARAAQPSRQQPEAEPDRPDGNCVQCGIAVATHLGFSCRCLCLCEGCVVAGGARVLECPVCEDFTEFVRA